MTALLLHAIIALAAFLQGITGIGFALIAGPALLLALNDGAALQIAALLSLLIAWVLAPGFLAHVDWQRLKRFGLIALLALPIGLGLYAVASPALLKLLAGLVIGVLTIAMTVGAGGAIGRPGRMVDGMAGGMAGLLGGALAMIGPPISLRMTATGASKLASRATVLALFSVGYPLLFAGQAAVAGVETATLWMTLGYVPATLIGALGGQFAVRHVSESLFRRLVIVFLIATAASLILNALSELI